MGIALANFPEFALWTFLSSEQQAAMPTACIDEIVRFLQYLVVDGKFYSIFSSRLVYPRLSCQQASAVYTFTGFALAEGSILECVHRSAYIIIICLECYEWTSLGTYRPFAALWRECDSSGHRIHNRYMPALSAEPQVCGVPMASCPRAYGIQLLYFPFAHWRSAVLWSRIRSWHKSWPRLYRIDSPCGILHSDYSVPHLAQLFPLRAAGMALADAHLRTLFPHNKIK